MKNSSGLTPRADSVTLEKVSVKEIFVKQHRSSEIISLNYLKSHHVKLSYFQKFCSVWVPGVSSHFLCQIRLSSSLMRDNKNIRSVSSLTKLTRTHSSH